MNNLTIKIPNINILRNINLEYIGGFLLIVFCNFWLYQAKPVVPLYYFFFISLFIFFISFIRKNYFQITHIQITSLICAFYTFIVSIFHNNPVINVVLHNGATFIFYFLAIYFLNYLKKIQVLNILKNLYIFTLIYTSIEAIYRLTHFTTFRVPEVGARVEGTFYAFKMNSIMFQDSNFVSLITLVMACFAFYIFRYVEKNSFFYRFMCIAFSVLTFLTISRAAIAALLVTLIVYYSFVIIKRGLTVLFNKHLLTLKFCIFIPIFLTLILCIGIGLFYLLSDGSFLTKVQIFTDLAVYVKKVSLFHLLVGIGSNLDIIFHYFKYATHALIPTYLVWYGLIYLFIVTYFWLQNIKYTNFKGLIIIIPALIAGVALSVATIHIFYISLALITYFEYILPKQERSIKCR